MTKDPWFDGKVSKLDSGRNVSDDFDVQVEKNGKVVQNKFKKINGEQFSGSPSNASKDTQHLEFKGDHNISHMPKNHNKTSSDYPGETLEIKAVEIEKITDPSHPDNVASKQSSKTLTSHLVGIGELGLGGWVDG